MEMMPEMRDYVRSLNASRLREEEISYLLQIMLQLDPHCGPVPTTPTGQKRAAQTFVRLMQGAPVETLTFSAAPWRTGHAR